MRFDAKAFLAQLTSGAVAELEPMSPEDEAYLREERWCIQHEEDFDTRPTVIHVDQAPDGWMEDPQYIYIGRWNGAKGLPKSDFANPYKEGKDGSRAEVIAKFRDYLNDRPELKAKARAMLGGRTLVCWCRPEACHGDVLADLFPPVDQGAE